MKLKQLDYENVGIKYYDGQPKIEVYKQVPVNPQKGDFTTRQNAYINWFAIDIFTTTKTIIFVPKGSIKQNFNLDAK